MLGQIPAEYDTWTQLRQAGVGFTWRASFCEGEVVLDEMGEEVLIVGASGAAASTP